MEGDSFRRHRFPAMCHFNPLPPHGGRRRHDTADAAVGDFNPLPPHGGRQIPKVNIDRALNFNPLPPHGGRRFVQCGLLFASLFQSTPSAWRETVEIYAWYQGYSISIHSLRMEGDTLSVGTSRSAAKFQSTPSAWRETVVYNPVQAVF